MANSLSKLHFPFSCLSGSSQCQALCVGWSWTSLVEYRDLLEHQFSFSVLLCYTLYLHYCCLLFNPLVSPPQGQFIASLVAGGGCMFSKLKSHQEWNNHFVPTVTWQSISKQQMSVKMRHESHTSVRVNHLILCTMILTSNTANSSRYKPLKIQTGWGIPPGTVQVGKIPSMSTSMSLFVDVYSYVKGDMVSISRPKRVLKNVYTHNPWIQQQWVAISFIRLPGKWAALILHSV